MPTRAPAVLAKRFHPLPIPQSSRRQAKQNASTAAKEQQQQKQQPNTTVPAAAAVTISDPTSLEQSEPASFTAGTGGSGVGGDDRADAGVDLSEKPYAMGADDAGVRVLCSWLNANVATTYIEVRYPSTALDGQTINRQVYIVPSSVVQNCTADTAFAIPEGSGRS